MEEVSGRTRALSLADESIGVLASRSAGATTVFGKIIGKVFSWYRQRRGRGGSRGFAVCAVPLSFPPSLSPSPRARGHLSRGHPVRGARARGRAGGGAAAAGGWRDEGRTGPLRVVALSTAPSPKLVRCRTPTPPAAAARTGLLVLSGLASDPTKTVSCARLEKGLRR